jgi:hypothetical protein
MLVYYSSTIYALKDPMITVCATCFKQGWKWLFRTMRTLLDEWKIPGVCPTHIRRELLYSSILNLFIHVSLLGRMVMRSWGTRKKQHPKMRQKSKVVPVLNEATRH